MPPKAMDALQATINSLTHELEMSTFVNKGVLQSNNEYKLRIVELERENAVLSTAERTLTVTEDALEASEKAVKDLEKERDGLAFRLKREEIARKEAERERQVWKGWFEDLAGAWKVTSKGVEGILVRQTEEIKEEERAKVSRNAGPSRTRPVRPDGTRATSRPRATQVDTSIDSDKEVYVPTQLSTSSARKKRRRQAGTPEIDGEEDEGPQLSVSPTPPPKRRTEVPRKSATSSATKKRPNNSTTHKSQDEVIKPKTELLSPSPVPHRTPKKRTGRYYSDDDPLAIGQMYEG